MPAKSFRTTGVEKWSYPTGGVGSRGDAAKFNPMDLLEIPGGSNTIDEADRAAMKIKKFVDFAIGDHTRMGTAYQHGCGVEWAARKIKTPLLSRTSLP